MPEMSVAGQIHTRDASLRRAHLHRAAAGHAESRRLYKRLCNLLHPVLFAYSKKNAFALLWIIHDRRKDYASASSPKAFLNGSFSYSTSPFSTSSNATLVGLW